MFHPVVLLFRFNGLNYLTHPASGTSYLTHPASGTSYVEWSREQSPGVYQANLNPYHRLNTSNRKSKTPETTLQKPLKRCSKTPDSKSSRKSSKSHHRDGLLLQTNGLPHNNGLPHSVPHAAPYYDKNARVYHITP